MQTSPASGIRRHEPRPPSARAAPPTPIRTCWPRHLGADPPGGVAASPFGARDRCAPAPAPNSERASHCRRFRNRDGGARVPEPAAHGHPGPVGPAAARIAEHSGCAVRVSGGIPHGGGRPGALGRNSLRILPAAVVGRPPGPASPEPCAACRTGLARIPGFSVVPGERLRCGVGARKFCFLVPLTSPGGMG